MIAAQILDAQAAKYANAIRILHQQSGVPYDELVKNGHSRGTVASNLRLVAANLDGIEGERFRNVITTIQTVVALDSMSRKEVDEKTLAILGS